MADEKLTPDDYTVAWICPLEIEQIAALEMLDREHPRLPQLSNDHNVYTLGSIQGHNVVVAGLPTTGNCSAATVVAQMRNTFPQLRFGLLVGIGGGVPTKTDEGPVRLGHIVVSKPVGQHSGAVQYDHGKAEANEFVRTGSLAPPPTVLLNAASALKVHRCRMSEDPLIPHLSRIDTSKRGLRAYKRPSPDHDQLYKSDYIHLDKEKSCKKCGCEASKRVDRDAEDSDDESACEEDDSWLVIHRGTIASGEAVMRNGLQRDALARNDKILCFEMEAAGALNDFPCLVIRGISDYSDSHKNDKWHGYAAAVAAAYARELFYHMPVDQVKQCKIAETEVEELVENSRQAAEHSVDSRIKDWLRPASYSINHVIASELCHPGTGAWFLRSQIYKDFLEAPHGRLWLRGIPGCGKTILASTVINDLRRGNLEPDAAVIYFFFDFNDNSKQKLGHMLRALVFQLYSLHKLTHAHLTKLFDKHRKGHEQPRTEELVELFDRMTCELRHVTVVLDALDESSEKSDLLRWIASSAHHKCRFVLMSRSEREIEEPLATWLPSGCAITLDNELVNEDIRAYVQYRLEAENNLSRWRSMHDLISNTLVEKAGGMFRWVYCQLEELSTCMDKSAVRLMLQTLPTDLNQTYDRILNNIPRSRLPNAIKLLQLLVFAKRPLSLEEVVDAVATDPESVPPFEPENRVVPPNDVVWYCSGFVRIIYRSKAYDRYEANPRTGDEVQPHLQLAHFSVQEYLLADRKTCPLYGHFDALSANATITRICLAYLQACMKLRNSSLAQLATEFPLATFAARYWLDHARVSGESREDTFLWTSKIFVDEEFRNFWLSLYDSAEIPRHNEVPALYYASLGGLDRSTKLLIDSCVNIDEGSSVGMSALQIAAHEGHVRIVEILLSRGANPKARNSRRHPFNIRSHVNALTAASANGHVQIVKILLEHGSDINAGPSGRLRRAGFSGTALRAASADGHMEVVHLLLDHGADVNLNRGGIPLHAALYEAHTKVSLLLIERGADIYAHDGDYKTALCAAVDSGDLAIFRLILERGAHINEKGIQAAVKAAVQVKNRFDMLEMLLLHYAEWAREYDLLNLALEFTTLDFDRRIIRMLLEKGADNTDSKSKLLIQACDRGHVETARLLLDYGTSLDYDMDIHDETCWYPSDPLRTACKNGHLDIVKLLVSRGAKLNHDKLHEASALQAACHKDHFEIAKYLLENGADVHGNYENESLPLVSSCKHGNLEMIKMLLSYGAKVNERNWDGQDALEAACGHGDIEIVRFLMDRGANAGACDSGALTAACKKGHVEIAQLLLAQGVDVHGRSNSETPMQAACLGGQLETVKLLLAHGADLEEAEGKYPSAFMSACVSGNTDLVCLLLDRGIDPDARDKRYGSALQSVSDVDLGDHLAVTQILLDRGADVNAQGGRLGSALYEAVYLNKTEVVRVLLDRGANVNLRDTKFGSALQAACSDDYNHNTDLIRLLLDNGADVNTRGGRYGNALCAAVQNSSIEVVQMLLARGANVNLRDTKFGSALQLACSDYRNNTGLVQLLLDNGADVNTRGGRYGNALCAAAGRHSFEVARMLLARGAHINVPGGRYGDALQIALRGRGRHRPDMVRTLINWGWKLTIRTRPFWKRRCVFSKKQPKTRMQKRSSIEDTSYGHVIRLGRRRGGPKFGMILSPSSSIHSCGSSVPWDSDFGSISSGSRDSRSTGDHSD